LGAYLLFPFIFGRIFLYSFRPFDCRKRKRVLPAKIVSGDRAMYNNFDIGKGHQLFDKVEKMPISKGKLKKKYICLECNYETNQWLGRCPSCNTWNSLEGISVNPTNDDLSIPTAVITPISEAANTLMERMPVGIEEFDRVLGGGIVSGSTVLVGGEPGIGKSTLLLQVAGLFSRKWGPVLYISAEESAEQIYLRASRLGLVNTEVLLASEVNLDSVLSSGVVKKVKLIIVDSVQTIYTAQAEGTGGSLSQVRQVTHCLQQLAKEEGIPVILIGHVTKQGGLAGPKALEHMVDVVLYLEGENTPYRVIRTSKNRFGSTSEIGILQMGEKGLESVKEPSRLLLAERPAKAPGSAIVCTQHGSRTILAEIQALAASTPFGGVPRRQVSGVDYSRSNIIMAVLEKRYGLELKMYDIYLNVVGGFRIQEPAADLGIALAIASSFKNKSIDDRLVAFGEIGLAGEMRSVGYAEARINECSRLGYTRCLLPKGNLKNLKVKPDMELLSISTLAEAIELALQ
jgi:DNA repair protein RadA/Sms